MESHKETIECPECKCVQQAIVEHTVPFASYVHICDNCKYIIMESEWKRVPWLRMAEYEVHEKFRNGDEESELDKLDREYREYVTSNKPSDPTIIGDGILPQIKKRNSGTIKIENGTWSKGIDIGDPKDYMRQSDSSKPNTEEHQ